MSKSGLYAHFGSKEELQLATVDDGRACLLRTTSIGPGRARRRGLARVEALCEASCHVERRSSRAGCFFASVSAELDTRPGPVRDRAGRRSQSRWSELVAARPSSTPAPRRARHGREHRAARLRAQRDPRAGQHRFPPVRRPQGVRTGTGGSARAPGASAHRQLIKAGEARGHEPMVDRRAGRACAPGGRGARRRATSATPGPRARARRASRTCVRPRITVLDHAPGLGSGLIVLGAKNRSPGPGEQAGPADRRRPRPAGLVRAARRRRPGRHDFRVQRYQGKPGAHLVAGHEPQRRGPRPGRGRDRRQLLPRDRARCTPATATTPTCTSSCSPPQGTALITVYHAARRDLSLGRRPARRRGLRRRGPGDRRRAPAACCSSGTASTTCRWPTATAASRRRRTTPYDYFHINSVSLDARRQPADLEPRTPGPSTRSTATTGQVDLAARRQAQRLHARPGRALRLAARRGAGRPGHAADLRQRVERHAGAPRRGRSSRRASTAQRKTATLVARSSTRTAARRPRRATRSACRRRPVRRLGRARPALRVRAGRPSCCSTPHLPPGYDTYRAYRFPWTGTPHAAGGGRAADRDGPAPRSTPSGTAPRTSPAGASSPARPRIARAGRLGRLERPRHQGSPARPSALARRGRPERRRPHRRRVRGRVGQGLACANDHRHQLHHDRRPRTTKAAAKFYGEVLELQLAKQLGPACPPASSRRAT